MSGHRAVVNVVGHAGSGKTTLVAEALTPLGFETFRPSDVIRAHARQHGLPLTSRRDYLHAHRLLIQSDPEAIIRPILGMEGLVALDGLRVYRHALAIQEAVGPDSYRTVTLTCPPELRFARSLADTARAGRDESKIVSLEDFLADDEADMGDPEVNMAATMGMHNLSAEPFDTSGPLDAAVADPQRHVLRFLTSQQS